MHPTIRRVCCWAGIAAILFLVISCGADSSAGREARVMENAMSLMAENQPIPLSPRSDAREALIQIEEAQIKNDGDMWHYIIALDGRPTFECLGKSFGIADTAQLSNPEALQNPYSTVYETLPQADPPGIFTPSSSQGTYILCNNEDGTQSALRVEPNVISSPFRLRWDEGTKMLVRADRTSSMHIDLKRTRSPMAAPATATATP